MKVTAKDNFKTLRNKVIGLPIKDFRALQAGQSVEIKEELYTKFKNFLNKEVKDGSKRNS